MLSAITREKLRRILSRMLDPTEFLSDYGIRSLSKSYQSEPYTVNLGVKLSPRPTNQLRPVYGGTEVFQQDPHWRDLVLFYEYFHGDNGAGIGASHQTGWTALVAKLLQQSGE